MQVERYKIGDIEKINRNISIAVQQTHKIFKVSYDQNYCSNSDQILHSDKDLQILSVGGPKMCP